MTGGIEAVGSMIEGGMLARAVEPKAGEGDGHTHEGACLNCGAALLGPHCHRCGQHAHIHRTVGAFFHDLIHGVLHFDGKTWRTLPLLAWKPGELTRRYIAGERARFVSPMALFLFSVFLMFAVFQLAGITPPTEINAPDRVGEQASPAKMKKDLTDLRQARAQMAASNLSVPFIDAQIGRLEKQLGERPTPADGTVVLSQSASDKARLTARYSGIAFIDKTIGKPQFEELFDEGSQGFGIQPGAYSTLKWNVIHVEDAAKALAARQWERVVDGDLKKLARDKPQTWGFREERSDER